CAFRFCRTYNQSFLFCCYKPVCKSRQQVANYADEMCKGFQRDFCSLIFYESSAKQVNRKIADYFRDILVFIIILRIKFNCLRVAVENVHHRSSLKMCRKYLGTAQENNDSDGGSTACVLGAASRCRSASNPFRQSSASTRNPGRQRHIKINFCARAQPSNYL
ncbi:MAG: hypothetical protein ACI4G1_02785, partial [Ruminococcus sp.]